jgi:quaternary ammonium compound-resistance protein SugE
MKAWIFLFMAGSLEIAWAAALKASDGFSRPVPAIFGVVMAALSFVLLSLALRTLPTSLAYPIWVAIGIAGVTTYGAVVLGEELSLAKIFSVLLIGFGVAGLASTKS